MDIKLINKTNSVCNLVMKPNFHVFQNLIINLVAFLFLKHRMYLNRPIYIGFTILDMSVVLLYDFHLNYIISMCGSKAQVLFMDTLCYDIHANNKIISIETYDGKWSEM